MSVNSGRIAVVVFLLIAGTAWGAAKPIKLNPSYRHDRWGTSPTDIVKKFQAFTVSFDSADDDDRKGGPDRWAIPEWAAYEVRQHAKLPKGPARPAWFTDPTLFKARVAPNDASYHYAEALRKKNPSKYPYDRGHMCAKYTAFRMGKDADWNTHTLLNACPQHKDLNEGIWEDLERKVDAWADKYKTVWVVCGPIINGKKARKWIGEPGEIPVAVPDAFFKIIIKEGSTKTKPDVLAFIYPNRHFNRAAVNHASYLVSVREIEKKTGIDFLRRVPKATQTQIEATKARSLWN